MEDTSLSFLLTVLVALLAMSAFFSLSETAMMAANRFRLRHLAQSGHQGAARGLALLNQTDRMLGVILLGNNLVNSAAATLVGVIAIELFGEEKWALGAGTLLVTFAILVFSEITPKIIGASHADRLALVLGYILTPLLRVFQPVVWFINLFASALLRLMGLARPTGEDSTQLTPEELRSLVLESTHIIPQKHRTILTQLFELNDITVDDVMTPRVNIDVLDIDQDWNDVKDQLATSQHNRLPVCRNSLDHVLGVLQVRRLLVRLGDPLFEADDLLEQIQAPYYLPTGTPVFTQIAFFQENRQRMGFVVDEYGEIIGLLTLEDIIEEFIGDFTTSLTGLGPSLSWAEDGQAIVEGSRPLREINRALGLDLPVDGPKTLNGLILDYFQDIPESGISLKLHGIPVEILKTQDRRVITARLFRDTTDKPNAPTGPSRVI